VPGLVPYGTETSIDSGWFGCSVGRALPSQGSSASGTSAEPKRTKWRKRAPTTIPPRLFVSTVRPTCFALETTTSAASSPPIGSFRVIERPPPLGSLPVAGIVCAAGYVTTDGLLAPTLPAAAPAPASVPTTIRTTTILRNTGTSEAIGSWRGGGRSALSERSRLFEDG